LNPGQPTWQAEVERRSRRTDPETSSQGPLNAERVLRLRDHILTRLRHGGPATDVALVADLHMWGSDSGIRTRRSELVKEGLVKDSGKRVKTPSGRESIVWESV